MATVTIGVTGVDELSDRFLQAWETGRPQEPRIAFESAEALWRTLTAERWELLKAMTGAGPLAAAEVARRAGKAPEEVAGQLRALADAGLVEITGDGRFLFPFDAVHVEFTLKAA